MSTSSLNASSLPDELLITREQELASSPKMLQALLPYNKKAALAPSRFYLDFWLVGDTAMDHHPGELVTGGSAESVARNLPRAFAMTFTC